MDDNMNKEIFSVLMTDEIDQILGTHLNRRDRQEELCFGLFNASIGSERYTGIVDEIMLPEEGDRNVHGNVSFNPQYYDRVLARAVKRSKGMANFKDGEWRPPVLMLESVQNLAKFSSEVENVAENMDAHYHYLVDKDSLSDRVRHNAKHEMICALKEAILNPVLNELIESGKFERMVDQLISKASDPYSLAEEIAGR